MMNGLQELRRDLPIEYEIRYSKARKDRPEDDVAIMFPHKVFDVFPGTRMPQFQVFCNRFTFYAGLNGVESDGYFTPNEDEDLSVALRTATQNAYLETSNLIHYVLLAKMQKGIYPVYREKDVEGDIEDVNVTIVENYGLLPFIRREKVSKEQPGYVCVMKSGNHCYICASNNPEHAYASLKPMVPSSDLQFLWGTNFQNAVGVEEELHERFDDYHINGKWFELSNSQLVNIAMFMGVGL